MEISFSIMSLHGDILVESRAGAPALGSGGDSDTFAPGLNPAPIVTFPAPALRTPACRFPAPGSPVASCASYTNRREDSGRQVVGLSRHHLRTRHGFRSAFPSRHRRAAEPVHASTTSNLCGSTPSLLHVMLSESLPSTRGFRHRHSRQPSSFGHRSSPEAPFLNRHYPASSSRTGLSATPTGPACPSRGSGWRVPRHRRGFPCCVHPPLACVPPPLPRRNRPVPLVARFPADGSLPRIVGGSASA